MKTKHVAQSLLFLAVLLAILIPAMGQDKDEAWACMNIRERYAVVFSPDSTMLASVSEGKGARILLQNVATRKVIREFREGFHVAFLSDGKTLVSAIGKTVRLWSVETGEEIRKFDVPIGTHFDARVISLALSPDGRMLAVRSDEGVRLWDVATGKDRGKVELPQKPGELPGGADFLAFSTEGQTLFTGQAFWDLNSRKELSRFEGNADLVHEAAFSPDGKILATTGEDRMVTKEQNSKAIRLWDVATGKEVRRLEGHQQKAPPFAFHPDGKTLVSGDFALLRFWDVASGRERSRIDTREIDARVEEVANLAFSPDGRMLALGHHRIKFWKITMEQLPDSPKVEVVEEPAAEKPAKERAKILAGKVILKERIEKLEDEKALDEGAAGETLQPKGLGKSPIC